MEDLGRVKKEKVIMMRQLKAAFLMVAMGALIGAEVWAHDFRVSGRSARPQISAVGSKDSLK